MYAFGTISSFVLLRTNTHGSARCQVYEARSPAGLVGVQHDVIKVRYVSLLYVRDLNPYAWFSERWFRHVITGGTDLTTKWLSHQNLLS